MNYLLSANEPPLTGTKLEVGESYKETFLSARRATESGLSLRDLDLKERLLKYRCSWMIHSNAFEGMPKGAKEEVYHRLWEILTAPKAPAGFEYLGDGERKAIGRILRETKKGLPDYWKS